MLCSAPQPYPQRLERGFHALMRALPRIRHGLSRVRIPHRFALSAGESEKRVGDCQSPGRDVTTSSAHHRRIFPGAGGRLRIRPNHRSIPPCQLPSRPHWQLQKSPLESHHPTPSSVDVFNYLGLDPTAPFPSTPEMRRLLRSLTLKRLPSTRMPSVRRLEYVTLDAIMSQLGLKNHAAATGYVARLQALRQPQWVSIWNPHRFENGPVFRPLPPPLGRSRTSVRVCYQPGILSASRNPRCASLRRRRDDRRARAHGQRRVCWA
ncbi:uncharacterized protein J3D65DRAFT_306181 [Phyllosticta citribraziliensis]|uniref:Uncharacterized protein n=1 Tax=Phyllosticta citribraziliensis TaxID=989973 RepID=A0ABR1M1V5_9PEZI